LYGVNIWTDLSTVLSQYTRVTDRQTDRRTDRRTEFSSLYRVCITCSAVKTKMTGGDDRKCKYGNRKQKLSSTRVVKTTRVLLEDSRSPILNQS